MPRSRRIAVLATAFVLALLTVATASADGEAGLVLQDGDAVTTYCVAFEGDGIRGDDLLRAAGHTFDAYGGGSGLAVCSIDDRGCQDAGSFSSCFCECQGGNCTYWAFFTRSHPGDWVYSVRAFNLLEAQDGDVHGWKWGRGSLSTAPAPRDVTFEQICGHAPRGGAEPPTPTSAPPPTAAQTTLPLVTPSLTAPATGTTTTTSPGPSPAASQQPTGALVTITNVASPTSGPSPTPGVPEAGEDADGDSGSSSRGPLVAFGLISAVLVALLGGGLVWRSRHGS